MARGSGALVHGGAEVSSVGPDLRPATHDEEAPSHAPDAPVYLVPGLAHSLVDSSAHADPGEGKRSCELV